MNKLFLFILLHLLKKHFYESSKKETSFSMNLNESVNFFHVKTTNWFNLPGSNSIEHLDRESSHLGFLLTLSFIT